MVKIVKGMKRGLLLLVFLISVSFVHGAGDCTVISTDCSANFVEVENIYFYSFVNSHICVGHTDNPFECSDYYGYKMCCPIELVGDDGSYNVQTYLSPENWYNGHVEITSEDNYGFWEDSYHYLTFWFRTDHSPPDYTYYHVSAGTNTGDDPMSLSSCYYNSGSCLSDDICILGLSSNTNAHVADCSISSFPIKMCCPQAPDCGDGEIEGDEECDGSDDPCDSGEYCNDNCYCAEESEPEDPYLGVDLDSSLCTDGPFVLEITDEFVDVHVDETNEEGDTSNSQGAEVIVYVGFPTGDEIFLNSDDGNGNPEPFITNSLGNIGTVPVEFTELGDSFYGDWRVYAVATKSGFEEEQDGCSFFVGYEGDDEHLDCDGDDYCVPFTGDLPDECTTDAACTDGSGEDPDDTLTFHRPGECLCPAGDEPCSDGIGERIVQVWEINGEEPDPEYINEFINDCFLIVEDIPFFGLSSFAVLVIILGLFYIEMFKKNESLKNKRKR
jgi:hypothetical protein